MANRHLARSIVLQTLFEWDFGGRNNSELRNILHKNVEEFGPGLTDFSFIESLLESVVNKMDAMDSIITKAAPEWPIDRISIIDRNVLRIGLYELIFMDKSEVPAKVAINEAIELAKTFGGESSGKFINGVLGTIYKEMGEPGKDEISRPKKNSAGVDVTKLPVDRLGGAVVYAIDEGKIFLAMVHDVFGYWTLSKGHIEEGESEEEGTMREIKEEIGLDIEIGKKVGENEYVANDPERGKIRKKVSYFLGKTDKKELELKDGGGLDEAKWFEASEVADLKIYNDIVPIITEAIKEIIL
ncbi:MAG TPA: transcription antitermination factor NusB [Candidatus Paceibacterota bacterium]|nr:transcription antitermination factor NusB [Candidatus Paceibacterota bacterium]